MAELEPIGQLGVPFRGSRAASGPLTFGQRDTLAWVSAGEDTISSLLFWRLRLPDGVRQTDVAAALEVLMRRHESLRTTIINGDEPVQQVQAAGELLVDVLRVGDEHDLADLQELENRLVAGMRVKGVDLAKDLPILAAIAVTADDVPVAGALLCSHVAADLGSLAVVGTEFNELVAMSVAGTPLPSDEPPRHQPLDQAEFERTKASLRRNESAVHYWSETLTSSPYAMYPMPAPAQPIAKHLSGFLHSRAGGGALAHIVNRVGAGPQVVLLAAMCTVMSVRTGMDRCVFALLSSNRFRQRLHGYVGALAQDSLLSFEIGGGDFDEVVRRVGAATLTANTHNLYDIIALHNAQDEIGHRRGIAFNRDFSFNNISDFMGAEAGKPTSEPAALPDPEELVRALDDSSITWLEWEHFPEMLMCHPVSIGPELVMALTANLRQVPKDDLELLLSGVERLLVAAAAGPVPLARCGEITGVKPLQRSADWVLVDSCWVELSSVRQLVLDALAVPAAQVVLDERGLVAYLPAVVDTAEAAHAACMDALAERLNTMAPGHYVLCDGDVPTDPTDTAAWDKLPVVAEGSGRR